MIKTSLAAFIAVSSLTFATNSFAQANTQGGFTGPSVTAATTIEEAKNMGDDTYVVLQGTIEQSLGDEKYMFKDNTGTIKVEIDNEDWNGLSVAPTDVVEIKGEVDKGWTSIEIEVDQISKIK